MRLRRQAGSRARPPHRPDADCASTRSSARLTRGARPRLVAGHHLQPRRVPRHSTRSIPAATGSSCRSTCSGTRTCRPDRINFLIGTRRTRTRSARATSGAIAEAGGIDLQILGIGTNGHIGFNEPGPELEARTHRVTLKPETRRSNAGAVRRAIDGVPPKRCRWGWRRFCRREA